MKKPFKKHYVTEMDDSRVQRCVYCGYVVTDYRNVMIPRDQPVPKGFPEGNVFILEGNPTELQTDEPDDFVACHLTLMY